ncbi:MAG: histidinol-phosphatase HisJ family protein [Clostridia bacterium]|nr:histidinol-phosphatase HisJ family protein [Clostridia bacterium]
MEFFDCHTHSCYSFDSKESIDEMVKKALSLNLKAITFTEHLAPLPDGFSFYENVKKSKEEALRAQEKVKDKLLVLSGVELEDMYDKKDFSSFYKMDLDAILISVHSTPIFKKYFPDNPYGINLVTSVKVAPMDFLENFIEIYYNELLNNVINIDADIVTHLTFPLRYINGRGKKGLDITKFYSLIDEVLKAVIKTGKTLEVNTASFEQYNMFVPDKDILTRYFNMGGRNISLGSDAHRADQLGCGFSEAGKMLKDIGFDKGSYFVGRKRFLYNL